MSIGNSRYVLARYRETIEYCNKHYDKLRDLFAQLHPRSDLAGTGFRVALESHVSAHSRAWHGVEFYAPGKWRPRSFWSGLVYLSPTEFHQFRRSQAQ